MIKLYDDGPNRLIASNGRKIRLIYRHTDGDIYVCDFWSGDIKSYIAYQKSQRRKPPRELYFGFATQVPSTCDNLRKFIEDRKLL